MNSYIQKLIREQFSIDDIDFNDDTDIGADSNIFNKVAVDPNDVLYHKIIPLIRYRSCEGPTYEEICELNHVTSAIKVYDINDLRHAVLFYQAYYPNDSMNWIDVSEMTDMSTLFKYTLYNGDISRWDVHNVVDMESMFMSSVFDTDISEWDVSNVRKMDYMFAQSKFNKDISAWDIKNVKDMSFMFMLSEFNQDISEWDVSHVILYENIFYGCSTSEEHKPLKFRKH